MLASQRPRLRSLAVPGGYAFDTGTVTTGAADRTIGVAASPGWFGGGNLGFALASGYADADAVADLVIAAPLGGPTRGGIVIVHGASATATTIGLSTVHPSAANGAVATLIEDPAATTSRGFGTHLHVVGPTEGAADLTDDIVVGYRDDFTVGDWVYVFRPDGTQPAAPGVTAGTFVVGRDVRIELVNTSPITEFGSQASTIPDQNGDGARELVISAFRATLGGQVLVIDGTTLGTGGVAQTTAPGITLTTIVGNPTTTRLGAALGRYTAEDADVDGDGIEDLLVAGVSNGIARVYVWFGGEIPVGTTTVASAGYAITAPAAFQFVSHPTFDGPGGLVCWVGDVDGDGIADVAHSSPHSNVGDGGFEILFD